MNTRRHFLQSGTGILAGLAGWPLSAMAQDYPSKSLTMVVPWPAGGPGDVIGRLFSNVIAPRVKQTVVVDNRPGATGAIGLAYAAKAPADGYTFALASVDTHAMNPHFYDKLRYHALEDFTAVGGVGTLPMALCVNADRGWNEAASFVKAARAQPGRTSYATWGNGSLSHVAMALFASEAKLDLIHVPYQGASPAVNSLMAGDVDAMIVPLNMALASLPGKRIKLLGTSTPKRVAPELPTLAEQGHPLDVQNWFGIVASGNPPASAVERISRELADAVGQPATVEALRAQAMQPYRATSVEFRAHMAREYARWGEVMKNLRIREKA